MHTLVLDFDEDVVEQALRLFNLNSRALTTFLSLLVMEYGIALGPMRHRWITSPGARPAWRALKHTMLIEINRRPLGDGIIGRSISGIGGNAGLGIVAWPEAIVCWEAICTKQGCGGLNYDRNATLKQMAC
ncbi:hypothetical protein C8J56DRAFT_887946 [Mycena floridula]|nr:hypothetical protein C8J56DRAFT_887946 [Mycena floridula]